MLKQSVITAIILLAVLIASYLAGPVVFAGVMAIGFGLAQWEWLRLAGLSNMVSGAVALIVTGSSALLAFLVYQDIQVLYANLSTLFVLYLAVIALLWVGIAIRVFFARHSGMKVARPIVGVTAVFFAPAAWLSFVAMYGALGITMVISLLMIVWVADSMAFGKNRMAPAISPKKSWEGVAGGMLSVILLGLLAYWIAPDVQTVPSVIIEKSGYIAWIVIAFVLVSLSIVGDLFESALKRQAGIKDSSNLLPGHGGFYDRLDAMMPTLPAGFLVVSIVMANAAAAVAG